MGCKYMSIVDYMTATKSEVTSVNKTALQIAVDVASNITDEELENVVPAVANELKAALEEAKSNLRRCYCRSRNSRCII